MTHSPRNIILTENRKLTGFNFCGVPLCSQCEFLQKQMVCLSSRESERFNNIQSFTSFRAYVCLNDENTLIHRENIKEFLNNFFHYLTEKMKKTFIRRGGYFSVEYQSNPSFQSTGRLVLNLLIPNLKWEEEQDDIQMDFFLSALSVNASETSISDEKSPIGLYWSSVIDSKQEQSLSLLRRSGINSPLESEFFFLVCMGIQPIHFTSEGVKCPTLDLEIS